MKMSVKNIMLNILIVLILFSCKKNGVIQNNFSNKVKTYSEESANLGSPTIERFNVSYDSQDRVISLISSTSNAQFLYSYNSSSSYTLDIKEGTNLIIRVFNYINTNSLIDSSFQYNNTNDSTTMKLTYNSSNQLIEQKSYDYSLSLGSVIFRKNKYIYNNLGDLSKDLELSATGDTNSITTYLYTNTFGNTFSLATIYSPTFHKHLPETMTVYFPAFNTSVTSTYAYIFDNSSRVIQEKQISSGGNYVIKKYEYY